MTAFPEQEMYTAQTAVFLMLRAKDGDRESFDELVRTYRSGLISYLTRLVRDRDIGEDLAQETFLRAYRSRSAYEPTARFETWLFRIATNAALNHIRNQRNKYSSACDDLLAAERCLAAADHRPNAYSLLVKEQAAQEIRAAVMALPEKQRAAVLLHKYEEMEYRQISAVLGCSIPAVKSLLFRAYERLRTELVSKEL
jgi:RNA polymerase sigma-70 factor (ECF subfamily)